MGVGSSPPASLHQYFSLNISLVRSRTKHTQINTKTRKQQCHCCLWSGANVHLPRSYNKTLINTLLTIPLTQFYVWNSACWIFVVHHVARTCVEGNYKVWLMCLWICWVVNVIKICSGSLQKRRENEGEKET